MCLQKVASNVYIAHVLPSQAEEFESVWAAWENATTKSPEHDSSSRTSKYLLVVFDPKKGFCPSLSFCGQDQTGTPLFKVQAIPTDHECQACAALDAYPEEDIPSLRLGSPIAPIPTPVETSGRPDPKPKPLPPYPNPPKGRRRPIANHTDLETGWYAELMEIDKDTSAPEGSALGSDSGNSSQGSMQCTGPCADLPPPSHVDTLNQSRILVPKAVEWDLEEFARSSECNETAIADGSHGNHGNFQTEHEATGRYPSASVVNPDFGYPEPARAHTPEMPRGIHPPRKGHEEKPRYSFLLRKVERGVVIAPWWWSQECDTDESDA